MLTPSIISANAETLLEKYRSVRNLSSAICEPLEIEDYVVQPVDHVSPPKWHLGHTTWFFETFLLQPYLPGYEVYDKQYNYVFNSYYETVGARVIRTNRGNLSRPSVADVYRYRQYVDQEMETLIGSGNLQNEAEELLVLGLNHEEQHQELLYTDIKYILGHNPLFPVYDKNATERKREERPAKMHSFSGGVFQIGFQGEGFCFDNEHGRHSVYLNDFEISDLLVTNGEYLLFMKDGGYRNFQYWHAEGWDWVKQTAAASPLYWHLIEGNWMHYTLQGLKKVSAEDPVCHINYYEAAAYAAWRGMRLPTEAEWEVASARFSWGNRWEWTESAYLPYPGFRKAAGAVGEYNGKFMVNQMVLRGASEVTSPGHSRNTYRNFFHPHLQWQFSGIRLAK